MPGPALTSPTITGLAPAGAPTRSWRELWAIEHSARLVAGAQTALGRLVLVTAFALAAQGVGVSLPYVAVAAAFAFLPAWRTAIALGATAVAVARGAAGGLQAIAPVLAQEGVSAGAGRAWVVTALAIYFACAGAALLWVRRQPLGLLARRPLIALLATTSVLAALATLAQGALRVALWAALSVFTSYLWVLAYAVQDQRSRAPGPLPFQMSLFHPFWRSSAWSSSPTPFGKGAAFLRKHQAHTADELAVTQLKALKLMAWALLLTALHRLLSELVTQRLGVADTASVYAAFIQGHPPATSARWASLVWGALGGALGFAIWGHKIIAVARLAGFRLPRNTWRPLQARTLAEFWNRYYYYFKELLVDFFFFPTFLRVLRRHPRLRVFVATFMAAGVGNALYHFLRDIHHVASMGWRSAISSYASHLFYCAVLAIGIGLSQARLSAGRQLPTTWAGSVRCAMCVWFFFVCLQVFGDETRAFPFHQRVAFFLSLFGIG